jgi:predicted membrane-bound spermidine synthase
VPVPLTAVGFAFFLSGAAALAYQLVWQRLLFAAFGVDIESVTIIVSIFMLGLGLGGYGGGALADRYPKKLAELFCAAELTIAVFGFCSVVIISWVAAKTSTSSIVVTCFVVFLILGLPTFCMGATLPMLVAYAAKQDQQIGVATGNLYFINTIGAAFGAFMTGFALLIHFDLKQVSWIAASLNLLSFGWMLLVVWRLRRATRS